MPFGALALACKRRSSLLLPPEGKPPEHQNRAPREHPEKRKTEHARRRTRRSERDKSRKKREVSAARTREPCRKRCCQNNHNRNHRDTTLKPPISRDIAWINATTDLQLLPQQSCGSSSMPGVRITTPKTTAGRELGKKKESENKREREKENEGKQEIRAHGGPNHAHAPRPTPERTKLDRFNRDWDVHGAPARRLVVRAVLTRLW